MFLNHFFIMLYKNFMDQIRQKRRNLMLFVMPIIIFAVIFIFFSSSEIEANLMDPINVGIICHDESPYYDMLVESFLENESFIEMINVYNGDSEEVYKLYNNGKLDVLLEVPDGYVKSIMAFESLPIISKVNYNDPLIAIAIKNFMASYESYITNIEAAVMTQYYTLVDKGLSSTELFNYNKSLVMELLLTAFARVEFFEYQKIVNIPSVFSTTYYFIAVLVMFIMYISVFSVVSLIREREANCMIRMKVSKMSIYQYIFSKALSITLFILLIVMCWYILFELLIQGNFTMASGNVFLLLAVIIFFDISFIMFISAFIMREEGVILFSTVFIFINSVVGGSIIPIHFIPSTLQRLSMISPVYWMIRGMLYFVSGVNVGEARLICFVLLAISIGMITVTGYRYKKFVHYY